MKIDDKSVQAVIDERIVPLIAVDGGRIELIAVDDEAQCVTVRFGGTYRGNPCRGVVVDFVVAPIIKNAFEGPITIKMVD